MTSQPPAVRQTVLEPGWRQRVAGDLAALVAAWQIPAAWEGMTQAGGVDLPGEIAGRVVLDELVVHGWDVARATGQAFHCDDTTAGEVEATFVSSAATTRARSQVCSARSCRCPPSRHRSNDCSA